jgi:hypothetical protein
MVLFGVIRKNQFQEPEEEEGPLMAETLKGADAPGGFKEYKKSGGAGELILEDQIAYSAH